MSRPGGALLLLVATIAACACACASREDITPAIVVSPGAKERIMVMDRLRHHGAPRRLLPKVTVEEVDEADLPAASDGGPTDESPTEESVGERDGVHPP